MKHYNMDEIRDELNRQDAKWGLDRTHPDEWWYAILGEEFGEIGRAMLENRWNYPGAKPEDIRQEIVQLVCVGLQWLNGMTLLEKRT